MVVDLTGLTTEPAPLLSEICAQLVWTLSRSELRMRVQIRVDGEPVAIEGVPDEQTVDDWQSFNPDAVPLDSVGHYVSRGALHTVATGAPVPGPVGTSAYGLTSAAVSADPRTRELSFVAGVRQSAGTATLLVGPYKGKLSPAVTGRTLSAPTVAGTRAEAWVVRDGTAVIRVPSAGKPQTVNAPTLAGLGQAEVLRLSPDAVRAALVVDGPGGRTLYVGTVTRAENGAVELRDLRGIAPSLSQVVDVAWRDSRSLLVLAGNAAADRIVPYSVDVDGWDVTAVPTAGLPGQAEAIGAAPTKQPLVETRGTIWQLAGGTWVTLVRGAEPLPGTAPFYPL
jgi:hypothetical protein